eukprot:231372-Chlamydomonas_euryale.AAC.2
MAAEAAAAQVRDAGAGGAVTARGRRGWDGGKEPKPKAGRGRVTPPTARPSLPRHLPLRRVSLVRIGRRHQPLGRCASRRW